MMNSLVSISALSIIKRSKAAILFLLLICLTPTTVTAKQWVFSVTRTESGNSYRLTFDDVSWKVWVERLESNKWKRVFEKNISQVRVGNVDFNAVAFDDASNVMMAQVFCDSNGGNREIDFDPKGNTALLIKDNTVSRQFLQELTQLMNWVDKNRSGDYLIVKKADYLKSGKSTTSTKPTTSSSSGSSAKGNSAKTTPSAPTKEQQLLRMMQGPLGYAPLDAASADLPTWRAVIKKTGKTFEEERRLDNIWFSSKTPVASLMGNPAKCILQLNIEEYEIRYEVQKLSKAQAMGICDELNNTLKNLGAKLRSNRPNKDFPISMTWILDDKKVHVYTQADQSGTYLAELTVSCERSPSEREFKLSPATSPGTILFGLPGVTMTTPLKEIKPKFYDALIRGEIEENKITTRVECRKMHISMPGIVADCKGWESFDMYVDDQPTYRVYGVNAHQFMTVGPSMRVKNSEDKLYNDLIGKLRAANRPLRKGSAKELKPYGIDIKAKEMWVVDNGNYRDYYVLDKNESKYSGKPMHIISILDK